MIGGFTFCGVDIADIGLEYAPDLDNTYVYRPTTIDIREESIDGQDGGYYYGMTKKPKEFILRCFFEEKAIDKGLMTNIYHTFKVGRSGKLVFKRKPWCYYYATVVSVPSPELRNYLNGLFTITMKAYYPYARCDEMIARRIAPIGEANDVDKSYFDVLRNTALFENQDMIPQTSFENVEDAVPILLANPGTERAPVCIKVSGDVGTGIVISNITTGQKCGIPTLTSNTTLFIDSLNGNVVAKKKNPVTDEETSLPGFLFHDKGFIELEPAYPCIRGIFATYSGQTVNTTNIIYEDVVGKYIFVDNQWVKIIKQIDRKTIEIDKTVSAGKCKTTIMLLNKIEITKNSSMNLSSLEFIYKPTFS